ncbi:MAG: DNA polymerase III subunit delta' [Mariprofundus sp.]|nr:DNA polymerase III subunit delta' [Mariprofundus sp.]
MNRISPLLMGHDQIEQRFTEALEQNRMHHAWLLFGMKGIGKRLLAERLAAYILCQTHTACGECHGCKMMVMGSHPDLFRVSLLESKRDLNIEQVRQLLSFLSLSGSESARRVVILDDAERLNNQAANALLKGLEEPSPGTLLLMVCSDMERLPATIRSRCMLQSCLPLPEKELSAVLDGMLSVEHSVADATKSLAMALADGCPGRVSCLQDANIAKALLTWQNLIAQLERADVGQVDNWIKQYVNLVPHTLIVQLLLEPVYKLLQKPRDQNSFSSASALHQAAHQCARWPADLLRSTLRPGPTLLASILTLRTAIKGCG